MADDDREWMHATADRPGAAVLVARLDARHTLTPLHAETGMRQAAEALSATLAQPPRERLLPLPGEGFAITAHEGAFDPGLVASGVTSGSWVRMGGTSVAAPVAARHWANPLAKGQLPESPNQWLAFLQPPKLAE